MGWSTKIVRGVRSLAPPPSDDRWGALLVPREIVEDHPRSEDRAFLLVRYTVVAAIFTVLFSPYFFFFLKLPYTLLMNVLYGISLGLTLVILAIAHGPEGYGPGQVPDAVVRVMLRIFG